MLFMYSKLQVIQGGFKNDVKPIGSNILRLHHCKKIDGIKNTAIFLEQITYQVVKQ